MLATRILSSSEKSTPRRLLRRRAASCRRDRGVPSSDCSPPAAIGPRIVIRVLAVGRARISASRCGVSSSSVTAPGRPCAARRPRQAATRMPSWMPSAWRSRDRRANRSQHRCFARQISKRERRAAIVAEAAHHDIGTRRNVGRAARPARTPKSALRPAARRASRTPSGTCGSGRCSPCRAAHSAR